MDKYSIAIFSAFVKGQFELRKGVFLESAENLRPHFDGAHNSRYWITTDDGIDPIAIRTTEDLKEFCIEHEIEL